MMLLFKLNLQLFADNGDGDGNQDTNTDQNVGLLLDKIKSLEAKIEEQDKKIAAVTDFNRRLLDGAKPADNPADDKKSKFKAYMKE